MVSCDNLLVVCRSVILGVVALSLLGTANGQTEESPIKVKFSGSGKLDAFYDTHAIASVREGHISIYPLPKNIDSNGEDIAAAPSFNMLAIQTIVRADVELPDAFGAKASGAIEAHFFGANYNNQDINGLGLRHAFLNLQWQHTALLFGQYWHPMFVPECSPGVISFNAGNPFQAFNRSPQIRLTHTLGDVKVLVAALSQLDFPNTGPNGVSSIYLRNAGIPNVHAQVQWQHGSTLLGAGGGYKVIKPRLTSVDGTTASDETLGSYAALAYAATRIGDVRVKLEGVYGQNMTDVLLLGGYAVQSTENNIEKYTPIEAFSVWGDIATGSDVEVGVFFGYSQNLGAAEDAISGPYYSFDYANNGSMGVADLMRVSPRIIWTSGQVRLGAEFEYTQAGWGTPDLTKGGTITSPNRVGNLRSLLSAWYTF